jgi:hypothetical protein
MSFHRKEFRDVAQELTNRIAEMIEATGKVPWKREWDPSKCAGPQAPINAFTGDMYHGINDLMFSLDPRAIVSGDPRWATFKQAADEDCQVKKGSKGVLGVFYKKLEVEDQKADDAKRTIPLPKTFHVFHATDIDGLPAYKPPSQEEAPWTRPEAVSAIPNNILHDPESTIGSKGYAIQSLAWLIADQIVKQPRLPLTLQIRKDIDMAKQGGQTNGAIETVERLLDLFWTGSDSLRKSAYLSLLSYRYLHQIPSDLVEEIDAILDAYPELENALSDGTGFYLCDLAGAA